jgi:hypothetical protein
MQAKERKQMADLGQSEQTNVSTLVVELIHLAAR